MPKTPFQYAVTFESLSLPPLTIRGETVASSTQAGARLAVKEAMLRAPGRRWTSLSVLLERPSEAESREVQQETIDRLSRLAGVEL